MSSLKDMPDDYWRNKLTPDQYRVTRQKGTEMAFSGKYVNNHEDGTYRCVACNQELFDANTKFDSGSGWPSFSDPLNKKHIELTKDTSHGMERTEVICANCGSHLGHLFSDGPKEKGGNRYCINSAALDFSKKELT